MRPASPGAGILLIAVLSLVEIGLALAIVWAVTGWVPGISGDIHRIAFVPRTVPPIAAGAVPRITIDDADSRVIVEPSSDGRVHVTDRTWFYGGVWASGKIAQLQVRRTADGVTIFRPSEGGAHWFWLGFSSFDRAVEVDVPPHAVLSIAHSSGAVIDSIDGPIDVISDDGRIEASHLRSDRVNLSTGDGRIMLTDVAARNLTARTDDGRIVVEDLGTQRGGTYDLATRDGSISLGFAGSPNATVAASTQDGSIRLDGRRLADDDAPVEPIRLGNGAARIRVATDDGSIRIETNGVL